jgi:hypothetical protein
MTKTAFSLVRPGRAGLYFLIGSLFLLGRTTAVAQAPPVVPPTAPRPDLESAPIVAPDQLLFSFGQGNSSPSSGSSGSVNRIRLFRIQPGFLSDPPGLDSDDKLPNDDRLPDPEPDSGPDWVTIAAGNDNPYFDFRRRKDPGGLGYTRINTQVQLFDTTRTAFAVGLQAVTPAGLQCDGLADKMGTTVVTPAVSLFHTLDDDATTAVQAFVGKHVPLMNSGIQTINRDLQCGVAVQRALTSESNDPFRNVYLSVGAVGQVRMSDSSTLRQPMTWEMLPGLHYRVADNWWISGAVVLPVNGNTTTTQGQQWQVTCSVQF